MAKWPIGVFTSVDAGLGVHLDVAQEIGVPTVQIHAPHQDTRTPQVAEEFLGKCKAAGITVTAVFGGFEGESYADIPTTVKTVGLVPEETRAARVQEMKEISDFAKLLGCDTVALHIGFVPEEGDSYSDLLEVTRDLLDHVKANGQQLNLETGQESAEHLLKFIADVERDNLFINFDPANMILYDKGDPILALATLAPFIKQCHIKDATRTKTPGEWGAEVTTGQGEVDWKGFFKTLEEIKYTGNLAIEREAGEQRIADIKTAKEYVLNL